MSDAVNDSIFGLMKKGRITSATMMANGPAFEDGAKRARAFSQCSLGIHLNASQFRPLSNASGLHPILDESGCFAGDRLRKIKSSHGLREALFVEWSAQVERVRAAG